jgi:hypothetical protein
MKVDSVSSHSDNERDDVPLATYSTEGSPASTFTGPIEYHRSCVILQKMENKQYTRRSMFLTPCVIKESNFHLYGRRVQDTHLLNLNLHPADRTSVRN